MKKLLCLFAGITLSVLSLSAQDKLERFINRLNRNDEVCRPLINTGNELKRLSPGKEYDRQTTQVRVVGRRVKKVTIGDVVIVNKKRVLPALTRDRSSAASDVYKRRGPSGPSRTNVPNRMRLPPGKRSSIRKTVKLLSAAVTGADAAIAAVAAETPAEHPPRNKRLSQAERESFRSAVF